MRAGTKHGLLNLDLLLSGSPFGPFPDSSWTPSVPSLDLPFFLPENTELRTKHRLSFTSEGEILIGIDPHRMQEYLKGKGSSLKWQEMQMSEGIREQC